MPSKYLAYFCVFVLWCRLWHIHMDRESFFGAQTSSPSVEVKKYHTPFTRYNRLSNRLYNRIDNRLNEQPLFVQPVVKPGCTTGLTTDCIHDTSGCQTGCQTGLTTGWMFVFTIQPGLPVVSCIQTFKNTKIRLYTSTVIPSAIYASETWRTTDKTNKMLNVFNRRCLRDIMGVLWKDHMTNEELLSSAGIGELQDIVADRRRRFIGHGLRLPMSRPASLVVDWTPEGGSRRWGRPKRTWQDTCRELRFARNGCQ